MTNRRKEILKAARRGAVSSVDIAFRLDVRLDEACRLLRIMSESGELVRSGTRRHYRYTTP